MSKYDAADAMGLSHAEWDELGGADKVVDQRPASKMIHLPLDIDVHAALSQQAKQQFRSLTAQCLFILTQHSKGDAQPATIGTRTFDEKKSGPYTPQTAEQKIAKTKATDAAKQIEAERKRRALPSLVGSPITVGNREDMQAALEGYGWDVVAIHTFTQSVEERIDIFDRKRFSVATIEHIKNGIAAQRNGLPIPPRAEPIPDHILAQYGKSAMTDEEIDAENAKYRAKVLADLEES